MCIHFHTKRSTTRTKSRSIELIAENDVGSRTVRPHGKTHSPFLVLFFHLSFFFSLFSLDWKSSVFFNRSFSPFERHVACCVRTSVVEAHVFLFFFLLHTNLCIYLTFGVITHIARSIQYTYYLYFVLSLFFLSFVFFSFYFLPLNGFRTRSLYDSTIIVIIIVIITTTIIIILVIMIMIVISGTNRFLVHGLWSMNSCDEAPGQFFWKLRVFRSICVARSLY